MARSFPGDVGVAVEDVQTGQRFDYNGSAYFPQQSVSKFWVALTILDAVDQGKLSLATPAILRRSDLTLFHQPIAADILETGSYRTTLGTLLTRALQQSDNTCNNYLLGAVGGPGGVRRLLRSRFLDGIRFGPGERLMQSRIAGLKWRKEFSFGRAFYQARSAVAPAKRRAEFNKYVANPIDGAQPVAITHAMAKLQRGELLSAASTARLLSIMSHTRTGPQRLKGGLAPGWSLAHKTGTGQQLGAVQTGYNDVGVLTSPSHRSYAVAVMIRRTAAPVWARMLLMQKVAKAVIGYDAALPQAELAPTIIAARKR